MNCVDIGSGYNPLPGYECCDVNSYCDWYSLDEIPDKYIDKVHIKNVIHHVRDVNEFCSLLHSKCNTGCEVTVIDCNLEYYKQNLFLDTLWYRWIFKRYDIDIIREYREIIPYFTSNGFELVNNEENNSSNSHTQKLIFRKMETIKEQLEENGYEYAVAIATQCEIDNGAACGQLSIIVE